MVANVAFGRTLEGSGLLFRFDLLHWRLVMVTVQDGLADLGKHEARPTDVLIRDYLTETWVVAQSLLLSTRAEFARRALLHLLLLLRLLLLLLRCQG